MRARWTNSMLARQSLTEISGLVRLLNVTSRQGNMADVTQYLLEKLASSRLGHDGTDAV